MKDAIRSFGSSLKTKGGTGLLFFSGHGVQAQGENYLLPIGERPSSEAALKTGAVTAAEAVDAMSAARNGLNIVVLDACRDNPLVRRRRARAVAHRFQFEPVRFVRDLARRGGARRHRPQQPLHQASQGRDRHAQPDHRGHLQAHAQGRLPGNRRQAAAVDFVLVLRRIRLQAGQPARSDGAIGAAVAAAGRQHPGPAADGARARYSPADRCRSAGSTSSRAAIRTAAAIAAWSR